MPLSPKQKAKARSIEEQLARKWWLRLGAWLLSWPKTYPKTSAGIGLGGIAAIVLWRWLA